MRQFIILPFTKKKSHHKQAGESVTEWRMKKKTVHVNVYPHSLALVKFEVTWCVFVRVVLIWHFVSLNRTAVAMADKYEQYHLNVSPLTVSLLRWRSNVDRIFFSKRCRRLNTKYFHIISICGSISHFLSFNWIFFCLFISASWKSVNTWSSTCLSLQYEELKKRKYRTLQLNCI